MEIILSSSTLVVFLVVVQAFGAELAFFLIMQTVEFASP